MDFLEYNLMADVSWYWRKLVHLRSFLPRGTLEAAVSGRKLQLYMLLLQQNKVRFANVVWCSFSILKHRFVLWQSILGHLLTRDNLTIRQIPLDSPLCPVCEIDLESHAHLFFDYLYSQQVLIKVADWLGMAIWPSKFCDWIAWMDGRPKGLTQRVLAAVLAATVYFIWLNRNNCVFNFAVISSNRILYLIKTSLKVRLLSFTRQKLGILGKNFLDSMDQL
ncbi:uncharacterized protein LOC133799825 [Humulus lupulus]|uniref:uncharacterized protein LOC133799825 n=1 Tax=Humulus lupulus TaxID=3486 RepID=UPI002B40E2AE|nr:uncharacterized protein LOC133799825 [Humulus lupulus]